MNPGNWHKKSTGLDTTGCVGNPLGIVQESEIWPYQQMACVQTRICLGEWDTWNSVGFWDKKRSPNPDQTIRHSNSFLKKRENQSTSGFRPLCVPQSEKQRKQREKTILRPCLSTEKAIEDERGGDTICYWYAWNGHPKVLVRKLEELEIEGRG